MFCAAAKITSCNQKAVPGAHPGNFKDKFIGKFF